MTKASDVPVHCSHSELADVVSLIPNPRNPNKHPDKQIAMLAKIIRHQGWRSPIVVSNRSGFVVKGHGRLEAAKLLQVEKVPVDRQDYPTEADEWADLIADNRIAELAETDDQEIATLLKELDGKIDLDLVGFDSEALTELDGFAKESDADADPQIDKAEELREKWGVKTGQLWELGDHRLLCGDSTNDKDVVRAIGGDKIDAVLCDPPYGTGIDASSGLGNSSVSMQMIGDGDSSLAKKLFETWSKFSDTQIWWGANYYSSSLPDSFCWLVWDKDHHGMTFADAELAFVSSRSPVRVFRHAWSGMHRASERGENRKHPTQKPVALYVWTIKNHAPNASVIGEPCSGSGTTIIACEQLGRKCRAIEISPAYVAVALQRWADATGKTPVLISKS